MKKNKTGEQKELAHIDSYFLITLVQNVVIMRILQRKTMENGQSKSVIASKEKKEDNKLELG